MDVQKEQKSKRSFWKFLLISCITGTVGLGTFTLLVELFKAMPNLVEYHIGVIIAEYLSVVWSCACSFLLNSKFTFKGQKARRMGIFLYMAFYFITTPIFSLMMLQLNKLGLDIILCKIVKMTINVFLDFFYCRYFIFAYIKKKYDETPSSQEERL